MTVARLDNLTDSEVLLADGSRQRVDGLGPEELVALQWSQEQAFAKRIVAAPKGSALRSEVAGQAYDTVTRILAAVMDTRGEPLVMGLHRRHEWLVLELLRRQARRGVPPRLFEIGYGAGVLLDRAWQAGYRQAGIEVSAAMQERACRRFGPERRADLLLGDFLAHDFAGAGDPYTLVYWNDVFEHIAPDEILDYLRRVHELLCPGGQLVTITPNWHNRPSDVTACVRPPRTEAAGLHLKEYTLGEVAGLLQRAGFQSVASPLAVVPGRLLLCGNGLARWKRFLEPCLEYLPYRAASFLVRGFALNCTIATKSGR